MVKKTGANLERDQIECRWHRKKRAHFFILRDFKGATLFSTTIDLHFLQFGSLAVDGKWENFSEVSIEVVIDLNSESLTNFIYKVDVKWDGCLISPEQVLSDLLGRSALPLHI